MTSCHHKHKTHPNMQQSIVRKYNELDINKLGFSEPNDRGWKITYDSKRLNIQTPTLFAPFGATCWKKTEDEMGKYSISWNLNETQEKEKQLLDFLKELDSLVCDYAAKSPIIHSHLGIKSAKKKPEQIRDIVENVYNPIVRESNDRLDGTKYPPQIRGKFSRDWTTKRLQASVEQCTGEGKEIVELTDDNIESIFPKRCVTKNVIGIQGVWVIGKRFGVRLTLKKIKVRCDDIAPVDFKTDSDDDFR